MNAVAAATEKLAPTAQASPDGRADSPVTSVLGSDPVGPGITDQAVPFQCSMTALFATLALVSCTLLKPLPTAQALLAESAVTSLSPVGSAVFAVFTIDQAVPL